MQIREVTFRIGYVYVDPPVDSQRRLPVREQHFTGSAALLPFTGDPMVVVRAVNHSGAVWDKAFLDTQRSTIDITWNRTSVNRMQWIYNQP